MKLAIKWCSEHTNENLSVNTIVEHKTQSNSSEPNTIITQTNKQTNNNSNVLLGGVINGVGYLVQQMGCEFGNLGVDFCSVFYNMCVWSN